jgi:hypothetical protein
MQSELITPFGRLLFRDRIQFVYLNEGVEVVREMVEIINRHGTEASKGEKYCVFVDMRFNVTSTPEARNYAAENSFKHFHIAYALLAKSLSVKLIANAFIQFHKPQVPCRIFNEEEEAIKWLMFSMKKMA